VLLLGDVLSTKLLPDSQYAILWEVWCFWLPHVGKMHSYERWGKCCCWNSMSCGV